MSPGLLTPPRCTDRPVWASPMWGYRDLAAVAVGGPEPAEGARLARADLVVVGEEKIPYAKRIGEGVTPGGVPLVPAVREDRPLVCCTACRGCRRRGEDHGNGDLEEHIVAGVGPPGREPWVVFAPTGRAVGDHVFWPFHARSELTAVAQAFVVEGLARRERVLYAGPGRPRDLRHDLAGVPDLEDCLDRGQLLVTDIATLSGSDASSDPVDELIDLAGMTRDSLDAGYTGLRMVGDGTMRVIDPTRRDRFVRYEHLVDRFCLDHPFTGLCALDATAVGEGLLAELGCVHKLTHGELSPFALRAAAGADAALVGSVDAFSVGQLVEALGRIGVPRPGGQMVLDAVGLELVDVGALRELDRYAADRGATVLLRSPPILVQRLLQLLEPRAVRLEPSP